MKHIVIFGAGRSASALIDYLSKCPYHINVIDVDQAIITKYAARYERIHAVQMDIFDSEKRDAIISKADLVISMLPARFHIHIAQSCIENRKHLLTASYVDGDITPLQSEIDKHGLLFLYECGLDPGIDHMSAMKEIDAIREKGGTITSFISYAGGLMVPGSDNNPWKYKFTWNPRNVVLAGRNGTAQYIYKGRYKNIPHHQLFKRLMHIEVPGYGEFESYPNRDSLNYLSLYQLENVETILRGTLRRPGFSEAWNCFVQLGLTDDSYNVRNIENMTYADFVRSYLPYSEDDIKTIFLRYLNLTQDSPVMEKIEWLGILEETPIGLTKATPAQVIQHLLEEKWKAGVDDKDMIVMQHKFEYHLNDKKHYLTTSMVTTGEMKTFSGMAKTVGYPMGIAAKLILENKITLRGLQIPVHSQIYLPILEELEEMGIRFTYS